MSQLKKVYPKCYTSLSLEIWLFVPGNVRLEDFPFSFELEGQAERIWVSTVVGPTQRHDNAQNATGVHTPGNGRDSEDHFEWRPCHDCGPLAWHVRER